MSSKKESQTDCKLLGHAEFMLIIYVNSLSVEVDVNLFPLANANLMILESFHRNTGLLRIK